MVDLKNFLSVYASRPQALGSTVVECICLARPKCSKIFLLFFLEFVIFLLDHCPKIMLTAPIILQIMLILYTYTLY